MGDAGVLATDLLPLVPVVMRRLKLIMRWREEFAGRRR
jgi:hypothetical protein